VITEIVEQEYGNVAQLEDPSIVYIDSVDERRKVLIFVTDFGDFLCAQPGRKDYFGQSFCYQYLDDSSNDETPLMKSEFNLPDEGAADDLYLLSRT
jgi:hypothetical protein